MSVASRWAFAVALVSSVLFQTGCGAHLMGPVARVRKINFEGNGGTFSHRGDAALRGAMAHPKPKGLWPVRKKKELDQDALETDKRRIANWYANRGYFDAEVVRWDIKQVRKAHGAKPPTVKVTGIVVEKEPSLVESITWEGLDEIASPLAMRIERQSPLKEGKPFDANYYDATLVMTKRTLQDQSFAYADAHGRIDATPSQHKVVVTLTVDPGPSSTFGEIEIEGGDNVPEKMLRNKLVAKTGEPYKISDLQSTQRALYGLQVFSVVQVEPDLSSKETTKDTVVPIHIKLKPRAPREIRIGGGVEVSTGREEALASLRFEHNNLFHRIVAFDLEAKGGYAILGADLADGLSSTGVRGGPVIDVLQTTTFPQVPAPTWQAQLELQFEENIEEAYRYLSPSARPSISGLIAKHWTLSFGYEFLYEQYIEPQIDESLIPELQLNGGRKGYINTQLTETILWDTRNDVMRPTAGGQRSLTLLQANHLLGGDFDYVGAETDLRGYLSAKRYFPRAPRQLVLAGRLAGGWLEPSGSTDRAYIPYGERLKLGGSNTVRGWIADHLGPYVCSVDADPTYCDNIGPGQPQPRQPADPDHPDNGDTVPVETVPVGGHIDLFGSLELRKYWESFGIVVFCDAGMTWEDPSQLALFTAKDPNTQIPIVPVLGAGFRYATPVGALRLDLAARTDRLTMYRNEPPVWFHLGLGEAF